MKRVFASDIDGDILTSWSIGNTFKALHVRTSEAYVFAPAPN